eukprot:Opistho-2@10592
MIAGNAPTPARQSGRSGSASGRAAMKPPATANRNRGNRLAPFMPPPSGQEMLWGSAGDQQDDQRSKSDGGDRAPLHETDEAAISLVRGLHIAFRRHILSPC